MSPRTAASMNNGNVSQTASKIDSYQKKSQLWAPDAVDAMNNNFFKTQDILSEKKSVRSSIQHHPIKEEPEFLSAYVVPKGEL